MMKIELIYVEFYGIERQLKFELMDGPKHIMFAHYIKAFEDIKAFDNIESGIRQFIPNRIIDVEFVIEYVLEINSLSTEVPLMIFHEIENSSHVHCIGIIKEVISENSFICDLGDFGDVKVILETNDIELAEKMRVEFIGDLSIELDQNLQLESILYKNG